MEKENKTLEYKQIVTKTYLKTVSAFANYNDGIIIFGITDDRKVVGIDNPHQSCLDIENQINDTIKPRPDFSLKINSDNTISLFVKRGINTPYRYNGKAFKRNDTSTIEVDEIEEKRLIMSGMNISFEELPCRIESLSFSYLEKELKNQIGLESLNLDILKSLNLFSKKDGYNNAAALLADENSFPGLDIVVFGENINIFRKRKTLSGESIVKQYFDVLNIYEDEYSVEKINGGIREKVELVPLEAFREVMANALVHRTWDVNANTKVEMHPDKIIVSSPGGLMGNMTEEDYISGNYSLLRNPIIANVFRRLNIIEAFATGIKRINESYRNAIAKPIYTVTDGAIKVLLPVMNQVNLNDNERKVLSSMNYNYNYTRAELEKSSGFGKDTLIRILNSLIEKGIIEKTGKAKATFYKKVY